MVAVVLPAAADDFLSTEAGFSVESEETVFSGGSGKTMASDGTRLARSGGWSFPTIGLAYVVQVY